MLQVPGHTKSVHNSARLPVVIHCAVALLACDFQACVRSVFADLEPFYVKILFGQLLLDMLRESIRGVVLTFHFAVSEDSLDFLGLEP